MAVFREIVGISFGLPLPAIVAKIGAYFKGVESSMLLNTNNVSTTQTVDDGFRFLYPTIKEALTLLIKK